MMNASRTAVLAVVLCAFVAFGAGKNKLSPKDAKALHDYVLTSENLGKLTAVLNRMAEEVKADPSIKDAAGANTQGKDLDATVKQLDGIKPFKAALQKEGLSTRDYVLTTFVFIQSGTFARMTNIPRSKWPPTVNPAQVEFLKAHPKETQALEAAYNHLGDAATTEGTMRPDVE